MNIFPRQLLPLLQSCLLWSLPWSCLLWHLGSIWPWKRFVMMLYVFFHFKIMENLCWLYVVFLHILPLEFYIDHMVFPCNSMSLFWESNVPPVGGTCFIEITSVLLTFVSSQMTATHQLKIAVMSLAFVGRSLFLTSLSDSAVNAVDLGGDDYLIDLLMVSLSNALLGMDANDPPKTLATMQLIGSIFSNVST